MNPPPPKGPGAGSWLRTHQTQAVVGAGAVVLLYALKKRASATSSTSLLGAPASTTTAGTITGAYPYDSTQLDQYNQLAGAISNLNDQISTLQASSPSSAVSTLAPGGGTGLHPISPAAPASPGAPSSPLLREIPNPTISRQLTAAGVPVVSANRTQFFNPDSVALIANPTQSRALTADGYTVISLGNAQYFNPNQKLPAAGPGRRGK